MRSPIPMGVNSRFGCLHSETLALFWGGQNTGARRGDRRDGKSGWLVDVKGLWRPRVMSDAERSGVGSVQTRCSVEDPVCVAR